MPLFVVETGTGLANSTSYVSIAEADDIVLSQPVSVQNNWSNRGLDEKQASLMLGTRYVDIHFRFYGNLGVLTQALMWPRTRNFDEKGRVIPVLTVPNQVKQATSLLAMNYVSGTSLAPTLEAEGLVESFTMEGLSVHFAGTGVQLAEAQFLGARFPEIEMLLRSIAELKTETYVRAVRITEAKVP